MQTATRNGARARAINGDRDRTKSGLKLVFPFICGSISLRKVSRPVLLVAPIRTTPSSREPRKFSAVLLPAPSQEFRLSRPTGGSLLALSPRIEICASQRRRGVWLVDSKRTPRVYTLLTGCGFERENVFQIVLLSSTRALAPPTTRYFRTICIAFRNSGNTLRPVVIVAARGLGDHNGNTPI